MEEKHKTNNSGRKSIDITDFDYENESYNLLETKKGTSKSVSMVTPVYYTVTKIYNSESMFQKMNPISKIESKTDLDDDFILKYKKQLNDKQQKQEGNTMKERSLSGEDKNSIREKTKLKYKKYSFDGTNDEKIDDPTSPKGSRKTISSIVNLKKMLKKQEMESRMEKAKLLNRTSIDVRSYQFDKESLQMEFFVPLPNKKKNSPKLSKKNKKIERDSEKMVQLHRQIKKDWSSLPVITFKVIKINKRGRRQKRTLRFIKEGIQNIRPPKKVSSLHRWNTIIKVDLNKINIFSITTNEKTHQVAYYSPVKKIIFFFFL